MEKLRRLRAVKRLLALRVEAAKITVRLWSLEASTVPSIIFNLQSVAARAVAGPNDLKSAIPAIG